jgi:hypothetical protein
LIRLSGITTNGRVPTLHEAKARFESSWRAVVRRVSKKSSSPKRREWSVALLRSRGQFLGHVKATSREAAETEAAKLFSVTEFQRRALLLQERL